MNHNWRVFAYQIYFYLSPNGDNPVKDFINSLDKRTRGKVQYLFDLLQEYGLALGLPYLKKIKNTPLWELRIISKISVRILYVKHLSNSFVMLHGFVKKSSKTPTKHLKIAAHRLKNLKN